MPRLTPFVKVEQTAQFGAKVVLEGDSVEDASVSARKIAAERDLTFVHPYDDPLIIAGQGTIGARDAGGRRRSSRCWWCRSAAAG